MDAGWPVDLGCGPQAAPPGLISSNTSHSQCPILPTKEVEGTMVEGFFLGAEVQEDLGT